MISGVPGESFYYTIEQAAAKEAEKQGVNLEIQESPSYEPQAETSLLNAAIAKRPDVIIIVPFDSTALNNPVEQAVEQGIPVITFDGNIKDESVPATFISANTEDIGRNGARTLADLVNEKGKIFYAGSSLPGVSTFFDGIRAGFTEAMSKYPEITETEPTYSDQEPVKASAQMQATLSANADLVGGWLGTTLDLEGNVPVLKQAGKVDLATVAVDGSVPNVEKLREGSIDAIISVKAADYGVEAVHAAIAAADGKDLPKFTEIGQCVLTNENLDDPANKACIYQETPK